MVNDDGVYRFSLCIEVWATCGEWDTLICQQLGNQIIDLIAKSFQLRVVVDDRKEKLSQFGFKPYVPVRVLEFVCPVFSLKVQVHCFPLSFTIKAALMLVYICSPT